MEPAASPLVGAMRALVEILAAPQPESEEWVRRRDAAVSEVQLMDRPPVPDDYSPEEIEANDCRVMEQAVQRARSALLEAVQKIRSMNGDPRLASTFLQAAGFLIMDGAPLERLGRAEETLARMWPLLGDVEDSNLRKALCDARQFCKVTHHTIMGDGILPTFHVALERLRARTRFQGQPQVLAFEPVAGRFLITSREIFERDRPFELGPEHVLFMMTA